MKSKDKEFADRCDPRNQFDGPPGLPTYAARVVLNTSLGNPMVPTWRCSAPGCGDKIKDARAIEVTTKDGIEHLHEGCDYEYEHGFDDRIPARGRLLFEEDL